jgi:hypothetical protein
MLPRVIPVDGLIVEISPGIPSTGDSLTIPIVFISLEKDLHFASAAAIKKVRNKLTERGIQNQAFEVKPFDLSAESLLKSFRVSLITRFLRLCLMIW